MTLPSPRLPLNHEALRGFSPPPAVMLPDRADGAAPLGARRGPGHGDRACHRVVVAYGGRGVGRQYGGAAGRETSGAVAAAGLQSRACQKQRASPCLSESLHSDPRSLAQMCRECAQRQSHDHHIDTQIMEKCGRSQGRSAVKSAAGSGCAQRSEAFSPLEVMGRVPLRGSRRGPIHRVEHPSQFA